MTPPEDLSILLDGGQRQCYNWECQTGFHEIELQEVRCEHPIIEYLGIQYGQQGKIEYALCNCHVCGSATVLKPGYTSIGKFLFLKEEKND